MRSSKTRSNATPKGCRGAAPSADRRRQTVCCEWGGTSSGSFRSEEHTSELQSQSNLVCRLLLEKKKEVDEHRAGRRDLHRLLRLQLPGLRPPRHPVPAPTAHRQLVLRSWDPPIPDLHPRSVRYV